MERQKRPSPHSAAHPHCVEISLIMPAWNEEEGIRSAVFEAVAALQLVASCYEIIVVDDGSCDATGVIVAELTAANPAIRLLRHEKNLGYGAALRTGFAAAHCELVAFTDADRQFDLTELDRFVVLSNKHPIVCGYRIDRQDPWQRCFYSRVYNLIVRTLFRTGVRDVDCALKMFHRDTLEKLTIRTNGFLVNSELLAQARQQNLEVVEVGVSHRVRAAGTSTVSVAHVPRVLAGALRYWWNCVQFPGAATEVRSSGPPHWAKWGILLAAAILLLTNLSFPLFECDETRYAEIPREMLATDQWVLPQLNFRPYYDKPVLAYWLCAASYAVFGVSAWSARLAPVLCNLGTLSATMWFGGRMLGRRVGAAAAVAAPWFILVQRQDPSFNHEFFIHHNLQRFGGAFHPKPFWYFAPVLLIAGHPWSFLALPYGAFLLSNSPDARSRRPRALGFLFLWSVWCLLFFSLSRCKLPTYILPAGPALALMTAHFLDHALFSSVKSYWTAFACRWSPWLATIATCVAGAVVSGLTYWGTLETAGIALSAVVVWSGFLAIVVALRPGPQCDGRAWIVCSCCVALLAFGLLHREAPRFAARRSVFGGDASLASYFAAEAPVATIDREWSGVPFDLRRNDVQNFSSLDAPELHRFLREHDRALFVLHRRRSMDDLRRLLPEQACLSEIERGSARLVWATQLRQPSRLAESSGDGANRR